MRTSILQRRKVEKRVAISLARFISSYNAMQDAWARVGLEVR